MLGLFPCTDPGRPARNPGAAARAVPRGRRPARRRRPAGTEPRLADRPAGGRRGGDPGRARPGPHDRLLRGGGTRAADRAAAAAGRLRALAAAPAARRHLRPRPADAAARKRRDVPARHGRRDGRAARGGARRDGAPDQRWAGRGRDRARVRGHIGYWVAKESPVTAVSNAWDDFKKGGVGPNEGNSTSRFSGSVSTYRYDYWRVAWGEFKDHPLLGRRRRQLRPRLRAPRREQPDAALPAQHVPGRARGDRPDRRPAAVRLVSRPPWWRRCRRFGARRWPAPRPARAW